MQFHKINVCQVMIFMLYAANKKHEMIKIGNQTKEKSQVLSQVLEQFCFQLYVRVVVILLMAE